MVSEYKALRYLHKPDNFEQLRQSQRRLKFDELFLLQLKRQYFDIDRKQNNSGIICNNLELLNKFYKDILKITLTDDKKDKNSPDNISKVDFIEIKEKTLKEMKKRIIEMFNKKIKEIMK